MAAESIWPGMFQAKAGRGNAASVRSTRDEIRDTVASYAISNERGARKNRSGQLIMNRSKQAGMAIKAIIVLLVGLALASVRVADAQQPKKVPQIGLLAFGTSEADRPRQQSFLQGLRDLGWIEGQNIAIERRYANESYNLLPDIAAELVRLRVDVIVVRDSVAIGPATQATKTIPIVVAVSGDPVAAGLIDSLARPGGNITGLTNFTAVGW
jgi:ABC-type uncharacterized transport system substrate-binding protein